MSFRSNLPEGWTETLLSETGQWFTGGTPSRKAKEYFGGAIPWVKSGDLKDGLIAQAEETITEAALRDSAAKVLPAGSVIIALYGATIGKLGVLQWDAATNQACATCVPDDRVTNQWFLFYYLLSQRHALIEAGQGGAQPNLSNQMVREWQMLLPPRIEQDRIVKRLQHALARAEAVQSSLRRVPLILKRFRQSVLAAACSGRLTEDCVMDIP